jgi:predicted GNAT superfamily acetyltransferase
MVPRKSRRAGTARMRPETICTADGTAIVLRSCQGLEELDACVSLQIETWGYSDGDVIPRRLFTVAQRIGGQVVGAFDPESRLVGFAMALPGIKTHSGERPTPYLHSHMLAVTPGYRNAGIGRQLKLCQRHDALSRGISLMEWTFDPLEIKNSFLNIHRLGVIVRSYTPDFYGVSSSRLQGGLPTDRLHAEWWMDSDRVKAILDGSQYTPPQAQETIVVPKALSEWKASATGVSKARAIQLENRERFLDAFARGLAVTGFQVDPGGNGIFELTRLLQPVSGNL